MKNAGIIGNFLMGIVVVAQLFESKGNTVNSSNPSKLFLVILLGIAYNALAHDIKFVKDYSWSIPHMIIAGIYLINTFWCPILEPNLALSLGIVAYHGLLSKKSSLNIFGYLLALFIYFYEGFEIIKESEKSFISWIKLFAYILLIGYYFSHLKEDNNKDKKH